MTAAILPVPSRPGPAPGLLAGPRAVLGKRGGGRYALSMGKVDAGDVATRARRRWPSVQWSIESFARHLGEDCPAHPEDLYLAGAAGHRLDPAWVVIAEQIGPPTQRVLRRLPTADCTVEDLWADALAKTMADDEQADLLEDHRRPARLIRFRAEVKLLNYYILIARRIAIQRQRKRKEDLTLHVRQEGETTDLPVPDGQGPTPDEAAAEREMAQRLPGIIAEAFTRLTDEQQFLVAMVYRDRVLQKEAGAMLGWSEFKTSRQMSKAISQLREALTSELDEAWTPSLAAAWEGCWQQAWDAAPPPTPAPRPAQPQAEGA